MQQLLAENPSIRHVWCVLHLKKNLREYALKQGASQTIATQVSNLLWIASQCNYEADCDKHLEEMKVLHRPSWLYVQKLPRELWARFSDSTAEAKRFDVATSNVAESLNSIIDRELGPLEVSIWCENYFGNKRERLVRGNRVI